MPGKLSVFLIPLWIISFLKRWLTTAQRLHHGLTGKNLRTLKFSVKMLFKFCLQFNFQDVQTPKVLHMIVEASYHILRILKTMPEKVRDTISFYVRTRALN